MKNHRNNIKLHRKRFKNAKYIIWLMKYFLSVFYSYLRRSIYKKKGFLLFLHHLNYFFNNITIISSV